jgi:ATP-dependent Clp protease ATP-binding subunit ClpA
MAEVQTDLHRLPANHQELRGSLMNGYNFTEHVRHSLAFARDEAAALNHAYVGTEHVLLGLLRVEGVGTTVIYNCNVDLAVLREDVIARTKRGADGRIGPDLPYTSRAKKCLELAMSEARELDHNYVGTEHLLLGLLREEKGIGAQSLLAAGVTLDAARAEMKRILGDGDGGMKHVQFRKPMGFTAHPEVWHSLPEPFGTIMADAYVRAKARGGDTATIADVLEAIIFSSTAVSAAFTSREIEIDALIADVRANTSE